MKKVLLIALSVFFVLATLVYTFPAQAKNKDEVKLKILVRHTKPANQPTTCSLTTNDQVTNYLLAGWQMPTGGMTYKINYSNKPVNLTNSQVQGAIQSSFATWNKADSKEIFNYTGSTLVRAGRYDGINSINWQRLSSSTIAVTYLWYYTRSGLLVETDTIFNQNLKWSSTLYNGTNDCGGVPGTFDLQNIATHEFGHWVGLNVTDTY